MSNENEAVEEKIELTTSTDNTYVASDTPVELVEYKNFIEKIKAAYEEFVELSEKAITTRTAGLPTRKVTLDLRALLKDFRKSSVTYELYLKNIKKSKKS